MQPSLFYTPNSKPSHYTMIPKHEHTTSPSYYPSFSPVSPKANMQMHRHEQRNINPNINNNHAKPLPTYTSNQIKPYKLDFALKPTKISTQKVMTNTLEMSYPRYGDMKSSYIGPDARQIAYAKQAFNEHVKTAKKLPRVSEPNSFAELETNESSDKNEDSYQSTIGSKRKGLDDVNLKSNSGSGLMYTSSMRKIDPEDLYKMRKSSFDPTQNWAKTTPKKKIQKVFSLTDFHKIQELGTGKYGKVFLVKQKATEYICALKIIQKQMLRQQQITEQFIRELKIQMYLNHPNIIKMYGYFEDSTNIYIIMEVAMGGQLYKQLKRGVSMPQVKAATIMRQVVSAVNQLHSNHVIHRDIKPQNIVLHQNVIKLCDFGWSVYHGQSLRTTFCGTPLYVSPQILKGNNYDEKIDIWSLGIMMYEMLVGENPFKITQEQELIKIIKDSVAFPSYSNISSEAKDFVLSCLQKNPNDRANIRQLMNHQFFRKYPQKEKKMGV